MFVKLAVASYFVLAVVVMGAVCVIYLSISLARDGDIVDDENQKQESGSNDVVIDNSSMVDEIVE